MEKYSRGRRGAPAKGVGRVTGAKVQILSSPPGVTNPNFFIFVKKDYWGVWVKWKIR